MSPAGYWPQLRAAVEAGADSVYFGLKHFSARAKVGFSLSELPDVMRTLHQRGVRGYVTFNTLVFEHETEEAARTIAAIAESGADAMIVQDLGITRLAHQIVPGLELHASTQMSITSAEGVEFARSFGVERVTLARELSLDEIRAIHAQTGGDLEMFVHGALCVAYSGQCFSSEAWGGRSANRGQCAQACRLPYEMLVDGKVKPLADARYLLSPGDLYTLREVPQLVDAGLAALKIEGRYKDAEYVALTTSAYRQAVDAAWAGAERVVAPAEELRLQQVYSRGLAPHFVTGTNHQTVVGGRAPRHRGVWMGQVVAVDSESALIEPTDAHSIAPLKPGDGVVFDSADWRSPQESEEGGRLYQVEVRASGHLHLSFANQAVRFSRIRIGDLLWRTDDAEIARAARRFLEAPVPVHKQKLHVKVIAREGTVLLSEWCLAAHPEIKVQISTVDALGVSQTRAISEDLVREQLSRLGNTPYELQAVELEVEGSPFVPASILNRLRRDAVNALQTLQGTVPAVEIAMPQLHQPIAVIAKKQPSSLHLLVRTAEQLVAAIDSQPTSITLDYLDLYGLRPSVQLVRRNGIEVRVASPRVLKPGETKILNFLLSLECPILVRSTGILQALQGQSHPALIGDFSLNTANLLTAQTYLEMGLDRLTPTHDLNAAQIATLARDGVADSLEVIAYQHLPVFHTEHCVFCRFLSAGTSYKDCGRPCEKHRVALRDESGRAHAVMADVGCRNTVFGAEAQEASSHLKNWLAVGIHHFRLEFVHETPSQVTAVAAVFARAFAGNLTAQELQAELREIAPAGVTEGSLFVPSAYLTLPILQ